MLMISIFFIFSLFFNINYVSSVSPRSYTLELAGCSECIFSQFLLKTDNLGLSYCIFFFSQGSTSIVGPSICIMFFPAFEKKKNCFVDHGTRQSCSSFCSCFGDPFFIVKWIWYFFSLPKQRERMKKQLEKSRNQKEKLESLCRSLQAERKQNSVGRNNSDSAPE